MNEQDNKRVLIFIASIFHESFAEHEPKRRIRYQVYTLSLTYEYIGTVYYL